MAACFEQQGRVRISTIARVTIKVRVKAKTKLVVDEMCLFRTQVTGRSNATPLVHMWGSGRIRARVGVTVIVIAR